LFWSGRGKSPF